MGDEDQAKAEKLAAAKKRFEQLKKAQLNKAKKDTQTKKEPEGEDGKEKDADDTSESLLSKQRSESFRQGSGPMSPSIEVQDLYKKQAARIEELEKESKSLKEQKEEGASRLAKAEEELEGLRENSSDVDDLKAKAKEADRLSTELESVQRQLTQAQQAAKDAKRRASTTSPDVTSQLEIKTSTIESLELELSNLRTQVNGLQTSATEHEVAAKDAEERVKAAETAADSHKQELDALKVGMAFPSDETSAAKEDPEALTKRINVLESDLRTANAELTAAAEKASSLEQKIETLNKLHQDTTKASKAKDKELTELRDQAKKRSRPSHVHDASEFELDDEETETGALHTRIRALEAENFDLRRGVWREKRASLQPGMQEDAVQEYEDVDLSGPYSPLGRSRQGSNQRQTSSFQDVLNSGINAFTGRPREGSNQHAGQPMRDRKQSLGLLSDDDDSFDENAFRLAQEDEAKKRIERIKEVKRGLEDWKGWRVDLVDVRQNMPGLGPVFEL